MYHQENRMSKSRCMNIKDEVKEYYNGIATRYNTKHGVDLYGCQWGIKHYYMHLIERFIPAGSVILEIGCGTGKFTEILKQKANRICAVDLSAGMLEMAKQRNPSGVEFYHEDCESLESFADNTFDVVTAFNAFSYFPNKEKALAAIRRVLKKGGIFFDLDMNGLCPSYYITSAIKRNEMRTWHTYIKQSTLTNLKPLFVKGGFDVAYADTLCWVPNALRKTIVYFFIPIDFIFSRIPIIKKFAMRLIVVGREH